jgi:hypothetical protein
MIELHLPLPLGELGPQDATGLRPGAAEAVAAALAEAGADKAVVVLDVCRQDRLMEYAHLHAVRHGSARSFAEQFPYFRKPVLDWADLADRIEAVPGVAEVVLRPAEAYGVCLGAPTFSARGVRVARALNAHVSPDEQVLVRQFVTENFPGPASGNQFLKPEARATILAAYAALNRALFRVRLPEFPEDAYSDDARTAALADQEQAHEHR